MTVAQLIDYLRRIDNPAATVRVQTPLATEMKDCEVTGVKLNFDDPFTVWLEWPTENHGSGETKV